jgi:hypothetical protein
MSLYAKLHTDILNDSKLIRAAREGAKNLELLPWLFAFAKAADDGGRLTVDGKPADPIDIARAIPCVTRLRVAKCLEELTAIGVLSQELDGALLLTAWEVRNSNRISDSKEAQAERQRRHREKKRQLRHEQSHDVSRVTGVTSHETERERESGKSETKRSEAKSDVTTPAAADLPPSAIALLEQLPDEKRAGAQREMTEYLNGGFTFKRGRISGPVLSLAQKCSETLQAHRENPISLAKLWPYTCTKLADVSTDSPSERAGRDRAQKRATQSAGSGGYGRHFTP